MLGIVPRRDPDVADDVWKMWKIARDKRRVFGAHADKVLSTKSSCSQEELYGFFGMVGIGKRWADDDAVEWMLFYGADGKEPGEV